jgi:hypothetical protein
MKFSEMFKDDKTGQLSLGRVLSAFIIVMCVGFTGHMMATKGMVIDIPAGWATTALALYGINKITSNVTGDKKNGDQ